MIVTLIVAGEVGFWVVLALALAARYLLGWRTVSTVLLLGLPLIDLVILVLTVLDLRHGTVASWTHGLAASYVGFSVAYGHYLVGWADAHVQHRFAGGPKPPARRSTAPPGPCTSGRSSPAPPSRRRSP
ncbi:hypothetical protein ACFQ0T_14540 [Kitasatospora gansuensis]